MVDGHRNLEQAAHGADAAEGTQQIAFLIVFFAGNSLAMLFVKESEASIIGNVRFHLLCYTICYFPLALVNIIRFLIQGMGFANFAILAGVFEMIARSAAGIVLVPILGYTGVCLGGPLAWILADAFLIPAYFYVKRVLIRRRGQNSDQKKIAKV